MKFLTQFKSSLFINYTAIIIKMPKRQYHEMEFFGLEPPSIFPSKVPKRLTAWNKVNFVTRKPRNPYDINRIPNQMEAPIFAPPALNNGFKTPVKYFPRAELIPGKTNLALKIGRQALTASLNIDIKTLLAANNMLKRGNLDATKVIIGRMLTPEEIQQKRIISTALPSFVLDSKNPLSADPGEPRSIFPPLAPISYPTTSSVHNQVLPQILPNGSPSAPPAPPGPPGPPSAPGAPRKFDAADLQSALSRLSSAATVPVVATKSPRQLLEEDLQKKIALGAQGLRPVGMPNVISLPPMEFAQPEEANPGGITRRPIPEIEDDPAKSGVIRWDQATQYEPVPQTGLPPVVQNQLIVGREDIALDRTEAGQLETQETVKEIIRTQVQEKMNNLEVERRMGMKDQSTQTALTVNNIKALENSHLDLQKDNVDVRAQLEKMKRASRDDAGHLDKRIKSLTFHLREKKIENVQLQEGLKAALQSSKEESTRLTSANSDINQLKSERDQLHQINLELRKALNSADTKLKKENLTAAQQEHQLNLVAGALLKAEQEKAQFYAEGVRVEQERNQLQAQNQELQQQNVDLQQEGSDIIGSLQQNEANMMSVIQMQQQRGIDVENRIAELEPIVANEKFLIDQQQQYIQQLIASGQNANQFIDELEQHNQFLHASGAQLLELYKSRTIDDPLRTLQTDPVAIEAPVPMIQTSLNDPNSVNDVVLNDIDIINEQEDANTAMIPVPPELSGYENGQMLPLPGPRLSAPPLPPGAVPDAPPIDAAVLPANVISFIPTSELNKIKKRGAAEIDPAHILEGRRKLRKVGGDIDQDGSGLMTEMPETKRSFVRMLRIQLGIKEAGNDSQLLQQQIMHLLLHGLDNGFIDEKVFNQISNAYDI